MTFYFRFAVHFLLPLKLHPCCPLFFHTLPLFSSPSPLYFFFSFPSSLSSAVTPLHSSFIMRQSYVNQKGPLGHAADTMLQALVQWCNVAVAYNTASVIRTTTLMRKVIGRTVSRNNFLRCLFIFISPLHVSALAGHHQAEFTIIFGKLPHYSGSICQTIYTK
jgi:hypothetical protein